ncbi:MAG: carboxylate-amine ligase, partial [Rhodospirillaceae bacterium]
EIVPYAELLEELIDLVIKDAEALGCVAEIHHLRIIQEKGTSAARQVAAYKAALADGKDTAAALQAVVDMLIAETRDPGNSGALPLSR